MWHLTSISSKHWILAVIAAMLFTGVGTVQPKIRITASSQSMALAARFTQNVDYDGRLLVGTEEIRACKIGMEKHDVCVWDVESGRMLARLKAHEDEISVVAISPDGKQVLTAGGGSSLSGTRDTTIWLWDVATGRSTRTFNGHTRPSSTST